MSFAKDQESFYRSQGWKTMDDKWKARNQHIYDQIISSAGDDKALTYDEYENIFKNRGDAWGRYAYSRDSIAAALAEAGSSGGIKLDPNARYMTDNDLAFDGDDILLRASGGWDEFDDDLRSSGKAFYERGEADGDDDYWNIYRFKGSSAATDPGDDLDPDDPDPDPVEDCPAGQTRGLSGKCIDDKEYADNPWEEPEKTPTGLKDKREDWDANWDPTRKVDDPSDLGSIPYWTPTMTSISGSTTKYKPSITEGKFNRYITGNDYDHSKEQIESVLRAAGYRDNRSY